MLGLELEKFILNSFSGILARKIVCIDQVPRRLKVS